MSQIITHELLSLVFFSKLEEHEAKNALDPAGNPRIFSKTLIQDLYVSAVEELRVAYHAKTLDKKYTEYGGESLKRTPQATLTE